MSPGFFTTTIETQNQSKIYDRIYSVLCAFYTLFFRLSTSATGANYTEEVVTHLFRVRRTKKKNRHYTNYY